MITSDETKQGDSKTVGRLEFNSFRSSIMKLGIKFSDSHNSMYDASSAAVLFATMCKESMCAEQASEILMARESNPRALTGYLTG